MKIYIPLWKDDCRKLDNPFVASLVDEILNMDKDVQFFFNPNIFWTDECEQMDIVHLMWTNVFKKEQRISSNLEARIKELKRKNIHIISTCHNLKDHVIISDYSQDSYKIIYENSEVIVHLGDYSFNLLSLKYPNSRHIIIPHHVYDRKYVNTVDRQTAIDYLNLNKNKTYLLCFGAFRNREEKLFIRQIAKRLKKENLRILAPSIMKLPYGEKNPRLWVKPLLRKLGYQYYGIITSGKFISDEELPYYYGASDISVIQRLSILNSGNVPMGFYMGKVVVGPNVGNVGEILQKSGNPTFDPNDTDSIIRAIHDALNLVKTGKGEDNKKYCMDNLSSEKIADRYYQLYKQLISFPS